MNDNRAKMVALIVAEAPFIAQDGNTGFTIRIRISQFSLLDDERCPLVAKWSHHVSRCIV